jgi:hypothetical protein
MASALWEARQGRISGAFRVLCSLVKEKIPTLQEFAEQGETSVIAVRAEQLEFPPLIAKAALANFVKQRQGYQEASYTLEEEGTALRRYENRHR